MINKIIFGKEEFKYPVFLFEYLYPYLFRFGISNGIFNNRDSLIIKDNQLNDLYDCIGKSLKELLDNCYEEPSHKNRSKHGSRYQKINFENNIYVVNFRTDPVGNTAYGISLLLDWIEKNRPKQTKLFEEE